MYYFTPLHTVAAYCMLSGSPKKLVSAKNDHFSLIQANWAYLGSPKEVSISQIINLVVCVILSHYMPL